MSGEHIISSTEEYQPPYYEHIEENVYLFDRWVFYCKSDIFHFAFCNEMLHISALEGES